MDTYRDKSGCQLCDGYCHGGCNENYDEYDTMDDCALMPDGTCMLAGSEFCDWECGRI